jgi:hypothetical protein
MRTVLKWTATAGALILMLAAGSRAWAQSYTPGLSTSQGGTPGYNQYSGTASGNYGYPYNGNWANQGATNSATYPNNWGNQGATNNTAYPNSSAYQGGHNNSGYPSGWGNRSYYNGTAYPNGWGDQGAYNSAGGWNAGSYNNGNYPNTGAQGGQGFSGSSPVYPQYNSGYEATYR